MDRETHGDRFSTRERLRLGEAALGTPGYSDVRLVLADAAESSMEVRAGVAETPFGNCLIAEAARGICHLSFFDAAGEDAAIAEMHADWPLAQVFRDDRHAAGLCRGIFSPDRPRDSPLDVCVKGTPFQIRVWRALLRVPSGGLVTYGKLAAAAGNSLASRATGGAVGANPVSFLIPCHRVIRADGQAGHYRWGSARKLAMLEWEAARMRRDFDLPDPGDGDSMPCV